MLNLTARLNTIRRASIFHKMTEEFSTKNITPEQALKEVQRELRIRAPFYKRRIKSGRLKRETAVAQYNRLKKAEEIIQKYIEIQNPKQGELFNTKQENV